MTAFVFAFVASFAVCCGIALVAPVPDRPFASHVSRRVLRMLARIVAVMAVTAVVSARLDAFAPTVLLGALAGWILPTSIEWWRARPRFEAAR